MTRSHTKGFTLVEMIITIFLFSLLIMIVSDVFSRAQQAQRRTVALQRLQDDMRFFFNKIASGVRNGGIAYAWYAQQESPFSEDGSVDMLALTTLDGKKILIRRAQDTNDSPTPCDDTDAAKPCILCISEDDGISWEQASSHDIRIDQLTFFITPQKDPFFLRQQQDGSLDYDAHSQPKVTFAARASSRMKGVRGELPRMFLQTTVSTREYKR